MSVTDESITYAKKLPEAAQTAVWDSYLNTSFVAQNSAPDYLERNRDHLRELSRECQALGSLPTAKQVVLSHDATF